MGKKRSVDTAATELLKAEQCAFVIHSHEVSPEQVSGGTAAADGIGVARDRVFQTIVAKADHQTVIALTPVSALMDFELLAATVGANQAKPMVPDKLTKLTGYPLDSISPIGLKKPKPTIVDISALDFRTIFVPAGKRGFEIEISPVDLVALLHARTAPIARFYS